MGGVDRSLLIVMVLAGCAGGPVPPEVAPEPEPLEVYGEAGTTLGSTRAIAWGPGVLYTFDHVRRALLRHDFPPPGPVESIPTPCPGGLEVAADPDYPFAVVRCDTEAVYLIDVEGQARPLGFAKKVAVGDAAMLQRGGQAEWFDAEGRSLTTRALPFAEPARWASAGSVWVAAARSQDGHLLWWTDLETGADHTLKIDGQAFQLTTDGRRAFLVTGPDLWIDLETGRILARTDLDASPVAFVGETLWGATNEGWIRLRHPQDDPAPQGSPLPPLSIQADARGVVGTSGGYVVAWDADGEVLIAPPAPWWGVNGASMSADGRVLAVMDERGLVWVIDRETGGVARQAALDDATPGQVAVSPDGGRIARATWDHLRVLDVGTGQLRAPPEGQTVPYVTATWARDGWLEAFYWDAAHAAALAWHPGTDEVRSSGRYFAGRHGQEPSLLSPDGRTLAQPGPGASVALQEAGPHSALLRYGDGAPALDLRAPPAEGLGAETFAWDAEGHLVVLWCGEADCLRQVGEAEPEPGWQLGPKMALSTDGQYVFAWDEAQVTVFDAARRPLASTPLVGTVDRAALADAAAALILTDGRIQVVQAP